MPRLIFDFTDPLACAGWHPIDDRVMGGVSRSRLWPSPAGHAVFEGAVSLDRNGGFASVRSGPGDHGLAGSRSCLIEVRGDPKQFKLSLITDGAADGLVYQMAFVPAATDWQSLDLPLDAFRPSFRGRVVDGAPPLDPARIGQVGLLIGARQHGPFQLDIRRITLA